MAATRAPLPPADEDRLTNGRTDLAVEWVESGGSARTVLRDGRRLIEVCAYFGDVSAIRVLLARGERLKALGADQGVGGAAFHGHWRLVEFLLECGASPNVPHPETGETPLHSTFGASYASGHDEVLTVLLRSGAQPNLKTKPGIATEAFMRDVRTRAETPLHRAAAFASEKAIDALLSAGADPAARDMNGDSPLSWASWHRRPVSILRRLSEADRSLYEGKPRMQDNLRGKSLAGSLTARKASGERSTQ